MCALKPPSSRAQVMKGKTQTYQAGPCSLTNRTERHFTRQACRDGGIQVHLRIRALTTTVKPCTTWGGNVNESDRLILHEEPYLAELDKEKRPFSNATSMLDSHKKCAAVPSVDRTLTPIPAFAEKFPRCHSIRTPWIIIGARPVPACIVVHAPARFPSWEVCTKEHVVLRTLISGSLSP